jgi:hypothetical protein
MKWSLLFFSLLLTGCATAQLELPADSYAVQGANPRVWNRPLSFGPYATSSVDEGTTRSFLADLGILQIGKSDQAYRMKLGDVAIECHTRELAIGRADVFVDPSWGGSPILVCGFDRGSAKDVLVLSRTGRVEPSLRGALRVLDGPSFEVRSLHRAAGGSFPSGEPFGYEIISDGAPVAVVETVNRGRVWIAPDAPHRDTLAAAAASLLLFRDPDAGSMN